MQIIVFVHLHICMPSDDLPLGLNRGHHLEIPLRTILGAFQTTCDALSVHASLQPVCYLITDVYEHGKPMIDQPSRTARNPVEAPQNKDRMQHMITRSLSTPLVLNVVKQATRY